MDGDYTTRFIHLISCERISKMMFTYRSRRGTGCASIPNCIDSKFTVSQSIECFLPHLYLCRVFPRIRGNSKNEWKGSMASFDIGHCCCTDSHSRRISCLRVSTSQFPEHPGHAILPCILYLIKEFQNLHLLRHSSNVYFSPSPIH